MAKVVIENAKVEIEADSRGFAVSVEFDAPHIAFFHCVSKDLSYILSQLDFHKRTQEKAHKNGGWFKIDNQGTDWNACNGWEIWQ